MSFPKHIRTAISFISNVRSYNITAVFIAQYLSALFIFSKNPILTTLKDWNLHFLVFATTFSIAAGYLINNFYDQERDRINNPLRTQLNKEISTEFQLVSYIFFNFIGLTLAALISGRAVLFYIFYQLLIWLYSHKLNKILFINNLSYSILSIFPVFAIFLYYKNFQTYLFIHAGFLFSILLISDIIKDLRSEKGDLIFNYKTLPNTIGEKNTKIIVTLLSFLNLFFSVWILLYENIGYMKYYFYANIFLIILAILYLYKAKNQQEYFISHQIFKGIIILGILSIVLIKI
ncbi:4-hydroxybenzoate polyprenyltransferase [Flavobacteriaceae bacterium UJ101]|nr:4-hydroxybenzoate polyprenyltransferase [Flavobacteriaceae bacterium UJ101]